MLEESVKFLQNFRQSGANQSIYQIRIFLGRLAENVLSNEDKISASIKKDGTKSECYVLLQFCDLFLTENTEVFLPPLASHGAATPPVPAASSEEDNLARAFLLWFLSRILVILGYKKCEAIHERTFEVVHHVLQTVRSRDAHCYGYILTEIILLVAAALLVILGYKKCEAIHERTFEVVHHVLQTVRSRDAHCYGYILTEIILLIAEIEGVSDAIDTGQQPNTMLSRFKMDMEMVLKSLQEPAKRTEKFDVVLSPAKFEIRTEDACETLQLNFMKVMRNVASDLPMSCLASHVNVFWGCLCCNIENGNAALKIESLYASASLLRQHVKLPPEIEDFFIGNLTAMIELLCSPIDFISTQEIEDMERANAHVLNCFLEKSDEIFLSSYSRCYRDILYDLADILNKHRLGNLHTDEMRWCMGRLVCKIQEVLSPQYLMGVICKAQRNLVLESLINDEGDHSSQYTIEPLVKAILAELSLPKQDRDQGTTREVSCSDESNDTPMGRGKLGLSGSSRKRKLMDDSQRTCKVASYTRTYRLLFERMDRILHGNVSQDEVAQKIEEMKTTIEIMATCTIQCNYNSDGVIKPRAIDLTKLSTWTHTDFLNELCVYIHHVIKTLALRVEPATVNTCLQAVLDIIGSLLSIQEFCDFSVENFQTFTWMSSMPWLLNDASWIDLKPANSREIVKICTSIGDSIDKQTVCRCLKILSLLPKEVCSKWRIHVYKQAMSESDLVIKESAVSSCPMLLYHLGPNANHLVYDLLHPCIEENHSELEKTLAIISGPLACVISRKAVLKKPSVVNPRCHLYNQIEIECLSCDKSAGLDEDPSDSPKDRPKIVDANMFLPFMKLVHSESTEVKQELIVSIRRMFGHFCLRKSNSTTVTILNSALVLVEDPHYETRKQFSKIIQYLLGDPSIEGSEPTSELVQTKFKIIQYLLGDPSIEGSEPTSELVQTKLREVYTTARCDNNVRLQETVLLTIAQLGRVSDGELLVVVIIVLLESMLSPTPLIAARAYEQLKGIADHKNIKPENLYMKCRQDICKFLIESMHDAELGKLDKTAASILQEVSGVLGFADVKSFLTGSEKYVVPFLVSKGTPEASTLIKLIANELSVQSRSKLLVNNTKYLFSYLVRFKQKEADLQSAVQFLQKETNLELKNLLRIDFQRVHNELLLHLSTNYSQVFHGLKILSGYEEQFKGNPVTTSEEMATYLQPRLLGVLAHFDSQLLNSTIPLEEKRPVLESLISIIRLMGSKIISGIRHKVKNTLRIGLQFDDRAFLEISCKAWNCFVRSLELSFLGQMMPQIVATLLPLQKQFPKQVAEIINYMIVDNRKALKDHFHDIYFLPDVPELSDAIAVLKEVTDGPLSQSDFRTQLSHSLKGIQHESLEVRLHALSKLKNMLKTQRKDFFHLVLESETVDPLVSKLISLLLKGCRESDMRAKSLVVECLGICSAIDPGRLEIATNNPKVENAKFHSSIEDDKFAVALINEVVKSYLASTEPRIQDCSAFALQELLSTYKISETTEDKKSKALWERFSEHVREILIPLLTSRYILAKTNQNFPDLIKPIYLSRKGNTFDGWVSTWTGYLFSKVKKDSKAFSVFHACSAVIKFDNDLALYILPYVVLHVLQDGSQEDINEVYQEIMEVLKQTTRKDSKQKGTPFHHMSLQTVFSVLDYLTQWKQIMAQRSTSANYLKSAEYRVVCTFLDRIPQDKLADASFTCKAYTRSLMHFEQFVRNKPQLSKEELDFMQRLYVELDEPDGVIGVAAIRQGKPTLQEQILTYKGRLGCQIQLQTSYELALQQDDAIQHHEGLLRCLMDLGQPLQALHHASGVIARQKAWKPQLSTYQVEAAWKLGNWNDLEKFMKADKNSRSWPVVLGRILLASRNKKEDEFLQQLHMVRQEQIGPLSAASMEIGSYQRAYEYIVRLHLLNEIEESMYALMNWDEEQSSDNSVTKDELLEQWPTRLKMMQSSFRIREPVLTMRRTLMMLAQQEGKLDLDRDIGQSWLTSAKIAQKTGSLQTAYSFLLQASEYNLAEYCIQKAKWLWEKGEKDQAMLLLEREIEVHFSNLSQIKADQTPTGKTNKQVCAKVLLLYGRYCEETSKMESNAIVKQYKEVIEVSPDWEDGYFYLGRYFDRIMTTLVDDKEDMTKQGEFVVHVVKNLGHSLRYGNQFIYQSMPRMLSLWLDFGSAVVEQEKKERNRSNPSQATTEFVVHVVKNLGHSLRYGNQFIYQSMPRMLSLWLDFGSAVVEQEKKERNRSNPSQATAQSLTRNRTHLVKLNGLINAFGKSLAAYQFFFAFSQLISRICHTHPDVFQQLKDIIARLVVSFPQRALWLLMAASKSSSQMRAKRCQEIFATAREMNPDLHKIIQDYTKLTERLLDLCEKDFPGQAKLSMNKHFRPLKRLLEDSSFSQILLPLQSSMTVTLSNTVDNEKEHNPFPGNTVYIRDFEDDIEILMSLQRPKKIFMKGSDGNQYVMMCKPKDDLRKDNRLMEFNGIVNKFLRKDPEARKRDLHIRTYTVIPLNEECGILEWTVIPLNEECGMLEWVSHTSGFRHILLQLYKEKGIYTPGSELKALMPTLQSSVEVKLQKFKNDYLPRHPPVFGEWFLRTFPDPTSWYNARLAYCKTAAVMSMVGYILGLGDRHGENILFDSTSGDCVHVDFNCLFNKGETFEWPERVPFRLTHNMIDAMGPLKLEGIFKRSCDVTLRVMRKEIDPLMSVLKPFVYDPLVEWSKSRRGQRQNPTESGEITNEQGKVHVQNIEHRLRGILNRGARRSGLALSVDGQVNHLIQEATNERNLCQMYIGWAPYL